MDTHALRTVARRPAGNFGAFILTLTLALGCVSDTASPRSLPRKELWNVVAARDWTIPAGGDGYECHIERLTRDRYITGFRVVSPSAAQSRVTLSVLDEGPPAGDFDCGGGAASGSEMIYASGTGADLLEFPAGEGVHVTAGQSLLLVVHLSNASAVPVTASTRIEGRAGSASDVHSPIEMFLAGSTAIHN